LLENRWQKKRGGSGSPIHEVRRHRETGNHSLVKHRCSQYAVQERAGNSHAAFTTDIISVGARAR
jgi:hypothetical protein